MIPKVTFCVLTYGDYPHLARRVIESIRNHCPRSEYRLAVGANAVSEETASYLEHLHASGAVDHLVRSQVNINKCPMMRLMFERVRTDFVWWFDDDSYITSRDAWREWLGTASIAADSTVMWGRLSQCNTPWDFTDLDDVVAFVRKASWYRGLSPPSWRPGGKGEFNFANRNCGDGRWDFIVGGCWLIRASTLRVLDWPDRRLVKLGDDVFLGEAIRQQGWQLGDIGNPGVVLNAETRRGRAGFCPDSVQQIMPSPDADPDPLAAASAALLERIRYPEIVPIEVGDLLLDGAVIRERVIEWGLVPALRRAIEILHAGQGATFSNGALPQSVQKFEAVFLVGGRSQEKGLQDGLSKLPCAFVIGEGAYDGIQGGFEILKMRGLAGWVVDLGQSQLKLATGHQLRTFHRDFSRLRSKPHVSSREVPAQRRRLREFISLKLQLALAEACQRPQAIVFGLPTSLADDGTPGTGDYAGMKHDRTLVVDALALAGLSDVPLLMLNDAELAAFGALFDSRLAGFRKILVLTLGFGIGAALICRSD